MARRIERFCWLGILEVGSPITDNTLTPRELAEKYGLKPVGVRPKLTEYVRSVKDRFEFLTVLASSRAQAGNQSTYLGQLWTILTPLLNSIVYVLIFGILLNSRRGMDNAIGFIVVGTFTYNLFSTTVTDMAKSIRSNIKLVQSLTFPRVILPLSTALKDVMIAIPGFAVMFVLAQLSIWHAQGGSMLLPHRWILVVPAILIFAVFAAGVGMVFANFTSRFPDTVKFLPFVLRLTMYMSGVIFSISHQLENSHGTITVLLEHQPVAVYLNLFRQAVLNEQSIPLHAGMWLEGLAWAVGVFLIGFIVFWRDEARYGRE